MLKKLTAGLVIAVALCTNVMAEEQASSRNVNLSLRECLDMAIKKNLDLNIQTYSPQIQSLELQKIRDQFGLYFGFGPQISKQVRPTTNSFVSGGSVLDELNQNYNFYLTKRFSSGGDLTLNFNNSVSLTNSTRVDINPAITPGLSINFNQPLLRDGFIGEKRIMIGENQTQQSVYNLKSQIIDLITQTTTAYWDLVSSQERLKILQSSLNLSNTLLKINQEKFKAGFASKLDILTAQSNIASKEESILQAQKQLGDSQDLLKRLINIPNNSDLSSWQFSIIPTDKPRFSKVSVDINKSLEKAYTRPDYQVVLLDSQNLKLQEQIDGQNRLPTLDLKTSAGLQSLDSNYFTSLGKLFNFQTYSVNAGVTFEIPIQGNANETTYEQTLLNNEKQKIVVESLKQKILNDIRNSVRAIEINAKRVEANTTAKKLAEEQVNAEIEKLNLGLSTNYQVLQYQRDFEDAGLNEVNATIDYIKSQNTLSQVEGSSLEVNNFTLDNK